MKIILWWTLKLALLTVVSLAGQIPFQVHAAARRDNSQADSFSDRKWYKNWASSKKNFAEAAEKRTAGKYEEAAAKYRAAGDDLKKVLRSNVNPNDRPTIEDFLFNVYTELANSLFEIGATEQAINMQNEGLKFVREKQLFSDKADYRAYFALSEYHNFVDNYAEAEIAARKGIAAYRVKMNGTLPARGNVEFCRALFGQQKYADAKTVCTATLKLTDETDASTRGMAHYYLGLICTNSGADSQDGQPCQQFYINALKEFETDENAAKKDYYLIGSLHFMLEDYPKAKEFYEKFLALYPRLDRARFNLGITYLRLSDAAGANAQLRELKRIRSKRAPELEKEILKVSKETS